MGDIPAVVTACIQQPGKFSILITPCANGLCAFQIVAIPKGLKRRWYNVKGVRFVRDLGAENFEAHCLWPGLGGVISMSCKLAIKLRDLVHPAFDVRAKLHKNTVDQLVGKARHLRRRFPE